MLTVGVDVAKATLEAALWQEGRAVRLGRFEQTAAGWGALRDAVVAPPRPVMDREAVAIVLEPTGGYELAFALWARQQSGWQVHRPNPARVRAWARSQGLRAKTDRQDALLLHASVQCPAGLSVWQPLTSGVSEPSSSRGVRHVKDLLERERRRQEQLGRMPPPPCG
jgi:transposase